MTTHLKHALVLALAAGLAACTVTDTVAPPLAGPSEMSLSLAITATPDVLSQDGRSVSRIRVSARDPNNQPVSKTLYVEIEGGDFGTLSTREVTTINGEAEFTYTAPPAGDGTVQDVSIRVRPRETDFASSLSRVVNDTTQARRNHQHRRAVTGVRLPSDPAGSAPDRQVRRLVFHGRERRDHHALRLDVRRWDVHVEQQLGGDPRILDTGLLCREVDGDRLAGRLGDVGKPGRGGGRRRRCRLRRSCSRRWNPSSARRSSSMPRTSTAGPGHQIVSYRWDWGDGQPAQGGSTRSHVFGGSASPKTGNFVVVLTVTDEAGQTSTLAQTMPVSP